MIRSRIDRRSQSWLAALSIFVITCGLGATTISAQPPVTAVAVAPDGKSVVVASQAGLEIRNFLTLDRGERIDCELDHIHDLAFSPDGKLLAAAGGSPGQSGGLTIYSWPERKRIAHVEPHRDLIYGVSWSNVGYQIATASADQRVGVLRVDLTSSPPLTVEQMLEGHSRGVLAVNYLSGTALLASSGVDETIRIWNLTAGQSQRMLSNHTRPVVSLAIRPTTDGDGQPLMASAGDDRTVRFWQPTIGRMMRFTRLESPPRAIAWSKDGTFLWAACDDGRLRQIDPDTAEMTKDLPAIAGVAYSLSVALDGSVIVGGENGQVVRINLASLAREK
jgi:WD40 repeat protein